MRHQAAINRQPDEVDRRVALNRERRRRGIYGKGGPDISHTSSGGTTLEAPSTNRARNGAGGKPRLRRDSPEGAKGKPCGASHIAKGYKCGKGSGTTTNNAGVTAAKIALVAGAIAGGVAIARKLPAWKPSDEEEFQAALKRGKKWDAYEESRPMTCDSDEEERIDGPKACRRRVGDPSFYGQYVIGLDGKTGFKSPDPKHLTGGQLDPGVAHIFENEAQRLNDANAAGVPSPTLLAFNSKTKVIKMEHLDGYESLKRLMAPVRAPADGYHIRASESPDLALKLLDASEKLHRAGLTHNDMHPGNIMLNDQKDLRLIDFGLATTYGMSEDQAVLITGRPGSGPQRLVKEVKSMIRRVNMHNDAVALAAYSKHEKALDKLTRMRLAGRSRRGPVYIPETDIHQARLVISAYYRDLRRAVQSQQPTP